VKEQNNVLVNGHLDFDYIRRAGYWIHLSEQTVDLHDVLTGKLEESDADLSCSDICLPCRFDVLVPLRRAMGSCLGVGYVCCAWVDFPRHYYALRS
jgi:hypothetical protein